jgi:hypothetical protein
MTLRLTQLDHTPSFLHLLVKTFAQKVSFIAVLAFWAGADSYALSFAKKSRNAIALRLKICCMDDVFTEETEVPYSSLDCKGCHSAASNTWGR